MIQALLFVLVIAFCKGRTAVDSVYFKQPNCSLVVNSTYYDLSVLRSNGDIPWTVKRAIFSNSHLGAENLITLNVCGPIVNNDCSKKASVCLERKRDRIERVVLGEFNDKFNLMYDEESKSIKLTYYASGFTSEILFFCKPGDLSDSPVLVDIKNTSNSTVFKFEWETGAACPQTTVVGSDCTLKLPKVGISFNLVPLQKQDYFVVPDNENKYDYFINVCGEVKGNHCGNRSVGACQRQKKENRRAFSLGEANSKLIYENGVLKLKYGNGDPYNNPNKTILRKTEITFVCDHEKLDGKTVFINESKETETYHFQISTRYACPHVSPTVQCSWENETHTIDLSALSLPETHHFVAKPDGGLIFINICRPLNPIPYKNHEYIDCGIGTSICEVKGDPHRMILNLGQSLQPPFGLPDGSLDLWFTHGGQCPQLKSANITSFMKFVCNENAGIGSPEFVVESVNEKECIYEFKWETELVCKPEPITADKECIFRDAKTGMVANLKALSKKPKDSHRIHIFHGGKKEMTINICDNANAFNAPGCKDAAVCLKLEDNTFLSFGNVSQQRVRFDGYSLWFHFPNGSNCVHEEKYSSSIEFICDKHAKNLSSPVFKEIVGCRTHFEWRTDVVCDLHVDHPCTLYHNDRFYDLRVLSSTSHAWSVKDPKTEDQYWINVCHSLPSKLNCWRKNSAVCRCINGHDCKFDGGDYETQKLRIDENQQLVLTYSTGYQQDCSTKNFTTNILFKCGPTRGHPKFVSLENCLLTFEWSSYVACPNSQSSDEILEEGNGYIYSERENVSISVENLFHASFNVTGINSVTEDTYYYLINLSNVTLPGSENCKNAAVCQTKGKFERDIGSMNNHQFLMKSRSQIELKIVSSNHQKCGKNSKKNVTTIFMLECVESDLNEPSFFYESNNCDYVFYWRSSDFCNWIPGKLIHADHHSNSRSNAPAIKHESSSSSTLGIVVLCLLLVFIISFFGAFIVKKEKMARIAQTVRNTLQPRSSPSFHYSQMSSDTAKLVASEYNTNETLESLAA